MTISSKERSRDAIDLLQQMAERIGDRAIDSVYFELSDFDALATTWSELQREQCVEVDNLTGAPRYRLTGTGWIMALQNTPAYDSSELEARLGKLCAYFKSRVKGRTKSDNVALKAAAQELGESEDWLFNTVESNLHEQKFRTRGVRWDPAHPGRMIVIPVTFGMEAADPSNARIAALEERVTFLQEELGLHREQLAEYRCPTCDAALASQGPTEHEYGSGEYRTFECGYAIQDGETEYPCPDGPEWPPFEEFEVVVSFSEASKQWSSWAKPLTRRARLVSLSGFGETEDEARRRLLGQYRARKSRWRISLREQLGLDP